MLLAAGGVPVAMKRRAINRSTKLRTSLYMQRFILYHMFFGTPALSFSLKVDTKHQQMCDS
jgi:hypothetical protein